MIGVVLRSLVACLLCLVTTAVHANGRLPGATGLAINPADSRQLLIGLSYGLALTRDGGASWTWMCEQQIEGNGSDVDPSIVVTGDGSLVTLSLTNGGVLVSGTDGCSFERASGPLQGNRGVDLTLDPSRPNRVLLLMSTIIEVVDAGYPRFRNFVAHSLDHGRSWQKLTELPDDFTGEAIEISASDPNRIYVSGTSSANPLQGIVERSDDGGLSWRRATVDLPRGSGSLFISAIHPSDPDRVWFRVPGRGDVYGVDPTKLWLSTDGAVSFQPVAQTRAGMLGFALSPDGSQIAFGGPIDGLLVAAADASSAPSKVSDLRVSCLRWNPSGLYVCAGEPVDPYSLGYAADPTQAFVPLWHRANTCREACAPPSTLESKCRAPWEMIAPLVGAVDAVCDANPRMRDAGPDAVPTDAGSRIDGGEAAVIDASPASPRRRAAAHPRTASGCTVAPHERVGTTWWLILVLMLVDRRRRRRTRS